SDVVAAGLGIDGFRVVDLDRLEKAATRYAPTTRSRSRTADDADPDDYDGLAYEPDWGWVNPDTGYTVEFDLPTNLTERWRANTARNSR
ncbi:MAG: hypothetical protein M3467_03280, partial [Actinomycetota bacterium]|nr:hypothetical protein [Actinomycetota bacterium]